MNIKPDENMDGKKKSEVEIDKTALEEEVKLFSNLVSKDIYLHFDEKVSTACTNTKDEILYNPKSRVISGNEGARALLQHEQAHIWFKTSEEIKKKLITEHPDMAGVIPELFGILEDYRVDGLWQGVFPGSTDNFKELYSKTISNIRGSLGKNDVSNPLTALLIARFGLSTNTTVLEGKISPDMKKVYRQLTTELRKLEGKDYAATYPVAENVIDMLKDWVKAKNGRSNKDLEDIMKGLESVIPMLKDETSTKRGSKNDEEISKTLDEMEGKDEKTILKESAKRVAKQLVEDIRKSEKSKGAFREINKKLEEICQKMAKERKANEPEEVLPESPSGGGGTTPNIRVITSYGGEESKYTGPAIRPSETIRNLLEDIRRGNELGTEEENAISGIRLDLQKLVRYQITKDPHCLARPFIKEAAPPGGVEFLILLDISSSMEGEPINVAKNTLGTIYDSTKDSDLVKIRMFGFYGNYEEAHVFEFDRDMLLKLSATSRTPTHIALDFITNLLQKQKCDNDRVVTLITDGLPDSPSDTKSAMERLTRVGAPVFTIFVHPSEKYEEYKGMIKDTFASSTALYFINSMQEVRGLLEKLIVADVSHRANKIKVY